MYLRPVRVVLSRTSKFIEPRNITCRFLFTKEELGVTQFERLRQNAYACFKDDEQIEERKAQFVKNFHNFKLDEKRDNLKNFLLLMNNNSNDLTVLKKLLVDYQKAYNNSVHFVKEFCFGTQIMRFFYLFNSPDEAVKFYKDPDLRNDFEQMQTYKVMLSLLFENKRYDEMLDMYKQIRKRLDLYELFPDITINCLAFGACYHLNTPEHFKYALDLWNRTQNVKQLNRSKFFLAGLAMKQNRPQIALDLVQGTSLYVTIRFIKLMAHTQLGNYNEACNIIRRTIENYKLNSIKNKPCFGRQMLEDLQEAIQKSGTREQLTNFNEIHDELKSLDLISDETLDQNLCARFPPMLPRNLYLKMKNKSEKFD